LILSRSCATGIFLTTVAMANGITLRITQVRQYETTRKAAAHCHPCKSMLDSQTFLETMRPPRKAKKLNPEELWEYALRVLHVRAYSARELERKLRLRSESAAATADVMRKLGEYSLLDDKRFAEGYAQSRLEGQGLGATRVLRDLRARSVPADVANVAVGQVYAETNEGELIQQYLERKFRGKNLPEYLAEEKHLASAFRRLRTAGFSAGGSIKALKQFAAKASELDEMDEDEAAEPVAGIDD
jgi:regulatory protein